MCARVLVRCFVLIVSTAVLCACAQQAAVTPTRGGGGSPCASGTPAENRQAPIVCVDDLGATLSVSPDPVWAHDALRGGSAPVTLQWFTRSGGGNLQIEVQDGCVTDVQCNGRGHCTAKSRDIDADTRCKYDVWTGTHPRLDPEVVITPCC